MSMKSVDHLSNIKVYDDWETPIDLYRLGVEQIDFTPELDVCATAESSKCSKYYKRPEGLYKAWNVDFFMNPPYSEVDIWIKRAYEQTRKYNVNGLILVFNKSDTIWYDKYVYSQQMENWIAKLIPIKGRINFLKNGIKSKNSSPYPSCWLVYQKNIDYYTLEPHRRDYNIG